MSKGVILLGHGSRREEANEEIRQIGRMVAGKNTGVFYEIAFLSIASPDLAEAVARLNQQGVDKIIVTPVFLLTGNHIAIDIPQVISELKGSYPNIEFVMAGHIGPDPGIAEIVKQRIRDSQAMFDDWAHDEGEM